MLVRAKLIVYTPEFAKPDHGVPTGSTPSGAAGGPRATERGDRLLAESRAVPDLARGSSGVWCVRTKWHGCKAAGVIG